MDTHKASPDEKKYIPVPTRTTIFMRSCIPYQLVRFAMLNLKILRSIGVDKKRS